MILDMDVDVDGDVHVSLLSTERGSQHVPCAACRSDSAMAFFYAYIGTRAQISSPCIHWTVQQSIQMRSIRYTFQSLLLCRAQPWHIIACNCRSGLSLG